MRVAAFFWFAPGVQVGRVRTFDAPPPREWRIPILEPFNWASIADMIPEISPGVQEARFRLERYARGGEVVHYCLDSQPREGWRWLAVNGEIRAERVGEPGDAKP